VYSYKWDETTGGLLLDSAPLSFSKEPRPVYYQELDILGFDKYWNYEKNDDFPYMWAEANTYWYRGRKVAQTRGGSLYTAPELILLEEPEPDGQALSFVDIATMVEKNRELMEHLVQDTIKRVYNTYIRYKDKVDVFYVAFSGGKDSIVLLDLVQRTLPHNELKVLFGDTGMEFPDTYELVDDMESQLASMGIEFIRAESSLSTEYTWDIFGPPATVNRWCCSVHKTAPQIIALRKNTGKINFTGLAFIGVRASESATRSEYDYISLGEKHQGQYSCNPIIEWNSAEVYNYIFQENLMLNKAYMKGNRRAGCLVCPRAAERSEYFSRVCYPEEFEKFISQIKCQYINSFESSEKLDNFIANGGWKARKNGRDIVSKVGYYETIVKDTQILKIDNPRTNWKAWIKTIGELQNDVSPFRILFRNQEYIFELTKTTNGYEVRFESELSKENPLFVKVLKNVFKKSASCIGCRTCEADCHNGCIKMDNGKVQISANCVKCLQCHQVEKGCLVYKSLEGPKGGRQSMNQKSLNTYSHHAPKIEWFRQYFLYKDSFDQNHSLGSQMYSFFRRFLRDAQLLDNNSFSYTATIIDQLGLENMSSWGIMLANLVYSPQINWYVKKIGFDEEYTREYVTSLLVDDGAKESWVNDIWSSFGRFHDLPFCNVGMGTNNREKNRIVSILRKSWNSPDPRVILYSLFKFAEMCGDYYSFTLSRLLNHGIESDGISPTQIFGLGREKMQSILIGLGVNYPEFIHVTFTHDLDNINLNKEKTSQDVLSLF
jgi:phosphoadenosine phosphosulfate reductase